MWGSLCCFLIFNYAIQVCAMLVLYCFCPGSIRHIALTSHASARMPSAYYCDVLSYPAIFIDFQISQLTESLPWKKVKAIFTLADELLELETQNAIYTTCQGTTKLGSGFYEFSFTKL